MSLERIVGTGNLLAALVTIIAIMELLLSFRHEAAGLLGSFIVFQEATCEPAEETEFSAA
jgi:hypothetical protein